MRLINTTTLALEEFYGRKAPPYAILSHTWGDDEVTYKDWDWPALSIASAKDGFAKIKFTCAQAKMEGIDYAWVDTNCIDKSSSAELSEAINSMYAWYEEADICYAYLSDVQDKSLLSITESRWFTRGWTLQELLAPGTVVFYNKQWDSVGSRKSLSMSTLISRITGVRVDYLSKEIPIHQANVAERMSWAANRQTTRPEDTAYCLMGIFGINMPILYGERSKAFIRLQEEILKVTTDQTIFAWNNDEWEDYRWTGYSVAPVQTVSFLALSPKAFEHSGSYSTVISQRRTFTMTNSGLSITLPVLHTLSKGTFLAVLDCAISPPSSESTARVCVMVSQGPDGYGRVPVSASLLLLEGVADDRMAEYRGLPGTFLTESEVYASIKQLNIQRGFEVWASAT